MDEKCRKIMGEVQEDTDKDGTGDAPIPADTMELREVSEDGTVVSFLTTATGSDGTFSFQCVPPGQYVLVELNPEGFLDVKEGDGNDPNEISANVATADSPVNQFVDKRQGSSPTLVPSPFPMSAPTNSPTPVTVPGIVPTSSSNNPTKVPTSRPNLVPTKEPTPRPSKFPTKALRSSCLPFSFGLPMSHLLEKEMSAQWHLPHSIRCSSARALRE